MYLVDTSVWIDFLRGVENEKVVFLKLLLEEGDACLCEVVYSEICFGAKNSKQFKIYAEYFGAMPFLTMPQDWHVKIAQMGYQLKLKGHKPFMADLMVAFTALHHEVILLTKDKDFQSYRDIFGLKIQ